MYVASILRAGLTFNDYKNDSSKSSESIDSFEQFSKQKNEIKVTATESTTNYTEQEAQNLYNAHKQSDNMKRRIESYLSSDEPNVKNIDKLMTRSNMNEYYSSQTLNTSSNYQVWA